MENLDLRVRHGANHRLKNLPSVDATELRLGRSLRMRHQPEHGAAAVQFNHRIWAYGLLLGVLAMAAASTRRGASTLGPLAWAMAAPAEQPSPRRVLLCWCCKWPWESLR